MSLSLSQIPSGTDIFIDANVFVYGLLGSSMQCKRFLERCSIEEITGLCLLETVNEASHVFMISEARTKGFVTKNPAKQLRQDFNVVSSLIDYWTKTLQILAMNLLFIPIEEETLIRAERERSSSGFLTNDSMILGSMRQYGVRSLATADIDFDRALGITVYSPTDLAP